MQMKEILERFRNPDLIVDTLAKVAWPDRIFMTSKIRPLFDNVKIVGTAVTVKTTPGIVSPTTCSEEVAGPDNVIVIDAGGYEEYAHWGGMITYAAKRKGIEGVIVDGAVCDLIQIRRLRFPVFARAVCPALGGIIADGRSKENINIPIYCGGLSVMPGDVIVGDDDGVAVIPPARAEELLLKAEDMMKFDEKERRYIDKGYSFRQLCEEYKWSFREMEKWADEPDKA